MTNSQNQYQMSQIFLKRKFPRMWKPCFIYPVHARAGRGLVTLHQADGNHLICQSSSADVIC